VEVEGVLRVVGTEKPMTAVLSKAGKEGNRLGGNMLGKAIALASPCICCTGWLTERMLAL
jgi:hypothetical protein